MAVIKTYVLAPNFSYHPNASFFLGDIIQYPDDPTKRLSSIVGDNLRPTETHIDIEVGLRHCTSRNVSASVWARFLESSSASVGGGIGKDVLNQYTIDRLETIYFREQPTSEEVAERVQEKKVQAVMNSGLWGKKPVFMITGLKVARGFKLVQTTVSSSGVHSAVDVPVAQTALGAGFEASKSGDIEQQQRTEQDIIFAYQLHIIKWKGWKQSHLDVNMHKPTAAFLNDLRKTNIFQIEMENATEVLLRECDEETGFRTLNAEDAGHDCVCMLFSESQAG